MGALLFQLLALATAPWFYNITYAQIGQVVQNGNGIPSSILKYVQGLSSIGTFVVPGFLAAGLLSDGPLGHLGLTRIKSTPILTFGLLLPMAWGATAISNLLFGAYETLPWPEAMQGIRDWFESNEGLAQEQVNGFLQMDDFWDFASTFFLMAILPAFGEELLFRGVLQPIFTKATRSAHIGIGVTAALFALMHLQISAVLPILFLGIVLGYLRYWSGKLWLSIILHLINNGGILVALYFFGVPYQNEAEGLQNNITVLLVGVAVFALSIWAVYRFINHKKTPTIYDD